MVLVQTVSLLLPGLSSWSSWGFLSLSGSTDHIIVTVSRHGELRARLDTNGAAYQVDTPMIVEPFPRRIGLFESLSSPVDRLLITICIYTFALRLPAIHFLLRQGLLPEGTYATFLLLCKNVTHRYITL